jgi:predicted enzyme related to lactoylglutathione lyase
MDRLGSLDAITIDCADPLALSRFWAAVFGTEVDSMNGEGPHYVDLRSLEGLPILRFQRVPEVKATKNRLHLDVEVPDVEAACARVEALGGRVLSAPFSEYGYDWRVVADPEGNEFCVVHRHEGTR